MSNKICECPFCNMDKTKLVNTILDETKYFYITSPNNDIYITHEFEPISQFMRIEIAKDLNLLDKYDWRKNDFKDNIILTIRNQLGNGSIRKT